MSRITDRGRFKRGRGTGDGGSYRSWIKARDFNSQGTTYEVYDWKTQRMVHCLSEGEGFWYYKLRFSEDVEDIKEQYPLTPLQETIDIAAELGYKGSFNNNVVMTTDFLVTMTDGSKKAVSIKYSEDSVTKRNRECLKVEEEYWKRRGIPYEIRYKTDLNIIEIENIMNVVESYDPRRVWDDDKCIARYLAAHHLITIDMTQKLDINEIVNTYKGTEIWDRTRLNLIH